LSEAELPICVFGLVVWLGREFMAGSVQSIENRRSGERFRVNAPLTVIVGNREYTGYTRDLGNRGVYFYLDQTESVPLGGDFDFLVELPPEITLSTCCLIRGQGRVVRTDHTSNDFSGIAAEILHYSMQREEAACA
jgi:hypothetical protein